MRTLILVFGGPVRDAEFETILAKDGLRLLRPARKGEPERPGAHLFTPLRQTIESINQTFTGRSLTLGITHLGIRPNQAPQHRPVPTRHRDPRSNPRPDPCSTPVIESRCNAVRRPRPS